MMSNFDLVEKLRERANVSYADAKAALDACGDDLLEALIYLERQGKVAPPAGGSYSSKAEHIEQKTAQALPPKHEKGESFTDLMNRFFNWCKKILHLGNTNQFEVWRHNHKVISVPVTVLVLFLILAFWVTLPLLVLGLFFSFRYAFSGSKSITIDVNNVMDSAADAANNLKSEVMKAQQNGHSHIHENHREK